MQPTILAIIGKPLAGKDTQADLIVAAHPDSVKISTGHIIRAVREEGETHRYWPLLAPYLNLMERGYKLPDEPIIAMIGEVVKEQIAEGKTLIVVSGSPRSHQQLDGFDAMAKETGAQLLLMHLDATDAETYRRSATRNEGRADDTPQVHSVRLDEYRTYVEPMVAQLSRYGRVIHLDGMQYVERVFGQLEQELHTHLQEPELRLPLMARR